MKKNILFRVLLFCSTFFCLENVFAQDNLREQESSATEKRVTPTDEALVKNQDYYLILGMPKVNEKIKDSVSGILEKTSGAKLINWCETDKVFVLECKSTNNEGIYKDITNKLLVEGYNFPIFIKEAQFKNIKEYNCQ